MILALSGIISSSNASTGVPEFRTSNYSNSADSTWSAVITSAAPHVRFINDSVPELDLHYGDSYATLPDYDIYVEWALEGGTAYYNNFIFHDSTVPVHNITFEYLSAGACPNSIAVEYKTDDIPLTLIGQPGMEAGAGIATINGLRNQSYGSNKSNVFSPLTITNLAVTTIYGQAVSGTNGTAGVDGASNNGTDGAPGADATAPGMNGSIGLPGTSPPSAAGDGSGGGSGTAESGLPSMLTLDNSHITNLFLYSSPGGAGGNGGNGGNANGGNGGSGGNGFFDSYANLPSQGGSGGTGGDGGTAGYGANGGNGGNGGDAYSTGGTVYGVFNSSIVTYLYRRAAGGGAGAAGVGGSANGGYGGTPGASYNAGGASMGSSGASGATGLNGSNGTAGTDNVTSITNNLSTITNDYN